MVRTVLAALLLSTTSAIAAPADDLESLRDDIWQATLDANPRLATSLGDRRGDGKLEDMSYAESERQLGLAKAFLARLDTIDPAQLTVADRIDHGVLQRMLRTAIAGADFGQERTVLFTNRLGWHIWFSGLPDDSPFFTKADFESYVGRLEAYGKQNADGIDMTRRAIKAGYTQPCEPMRGFERTIEGRIAEKAELAIIMGERTALDVLTAVAPVSFTSERNGQIEKLHVVAIARKSTWDKLVPKLERDPRLSQKPATVARAAGAGLPL